jgi:uncharacterized protein (DUF1800 family)
MRRPAARRPRSLLAATSENSVAPPSETAPSSAPASSTVLPPLGVIALNRMGFGPRPGDLEAFEALGTSDSARLEAYIEQQLNPDSIDDSEVVARLAAGKFTTLNKTREQLWVDHHVGPPGGPEPDGTKRLEPFWETERSTFIRAIYSRRQLASVLTDFWHNHFNVFGADYWSAPFWVHYDRDIIRAHILGNFRHFLETVAKSFPMMLYLDGYGNAVAGPNENFARELFELHGLGAENYLGVRRQDEVPFDSERRPVGYVDDDVYESTRAFTGWGIDFNTGEFRYYSERHDRFQKYVLGRFLRADQAPLKDATDVLDLVAAHPGTARFICRKLCRRLIADDPPQRVVTEAAAVFLAQKDAPDQIKQVVRTILRSPEFRTTWGQRVKRPFEFAVSAFRATGTELSFELYHQPSEYFMSLYAQAGQALFRWTTPDGYPDTREKWLGSNPFVGRWRIANWLCEVKNWWDRSYKPFDPIAQMPSNVRSATAIVDYWLQRIVARPISEAARREMVEFMARGRDPLMEWRGFDDDPLRERVWGTIALILTSPENLFQ